MKRIPIISLTIVSFLGSYALSVQAEEKKDREDKEKISVDERFEFLDKNKNDELSINEFSKARFLNDEDRKHVAKVFARYDKNDDDALRPREFETGVETHHPHHFHRHHRHVAKGKPGAAEGKGKQSKGNDGKSKGKPGGKKTGKGGK